MIENDINEYYSNISSDYLLDICKNNKFKNLIKLSIETNINIFNINKNNYKIKNQEQLLKECEIIKKKEIKNSSSKLSNLAKLNTNYNYDVKNIFNNLENKINKIDELIISIKTINKSNIESNNIINKNIYLEYYSN